ncbi:uncharacterized protein LOC132933747 [Metopolophium dirhodum]|uniref:uncharacterized protein LOC132933747 n=1 Tax=Metopolophium dirhodum TaxID=44670 RepID=UPI00298FE4DB|nr:uncharacterized protein LOC132933747 [Metopolophium dirhodum]
MSNNSSPSTPTYEGDEYNRRLAEIPSQSPVLFDMQDIFIYGEMTQSEDSGYLTGQNTQVENHDWHREFYPLQPHATPSPPRLSQMENRVRTLSPVQPVLLEEASPDIFPPTTPRAYVLRVRNDLFPDLDSQSSVSPSMLELPRAMVPPEYNLLIVGEIMNTTRHSGEQSPEMDWSDDGNDEELNRHMEAYEDDEKLSRHMDEYDGF